MAASDCGSAGCGMESPVPLPTTVGGGGGGRGSLNGVHHRKQLRGFFEMPLHYPRYTKADYEAMPEWKLDCLLAEYGLPVTGEGMEQKRKFAMGAFLWPN